MYRVKKVFFLLLLLQMAAGTHVFASQTANADTTPHSTQKEAFIFLASAKNLAASNFWPNIAPLPFLKNLEKNIENPLSLYEGRSTNFCAYAALSYMPLHEDPLGYVRFMVQLYIAGKARYGKAWIEPTREVRITAGTLSFKGELDIRPADQLWFLSLADHFKGYLNFLDHHYDAGDENKMWASVNFAKFNRMVRELLNYRVSAIGSDLLRPGVRDLFEYLNERTQTGHVALFVNNLDLYKKSHTLIKFAVPTHFIILLAIEEVEDDKVAITYWDYGGKSKQVVKLDFLKKIIFGISHITIKSSHGK
jgi:hypothetical protein